MPNIYVNTNYFSVQNHNMAYIMGFLAADGNISKNGNRIQSQLSIKDKNQLEMIHNEIGGCEVYEYSSNGYPSCGWHCYSAQIKKDLATYGIIPNKTGTLRVPQNLKKEYWKDFIRGYFDGDGSISYGIRERYSVRKKQNTKRLSMNAEFIGTKEMLTVINNCVNFNGLEKEKRRNSNT